MLRQWEKPSDFKGWAVFALGLFFILFGLPLLIGGARLIALGGSWYYLPAGIAFITSGALLMLRRRLGASVYGALFVVTVLWSLFEVGLDGWALVPRIFGLSILLLLVLLALPVLRPARSVRRFALTGMGGFAAVVVTLGMLLVNAGRPTVHGAVPVASTAATGAATMPVGTDWPAYGGTYAAQRYSSLTQINRDNVGQLTRAWEYRTGDLPPRRECAPLWLDQFLAHLPRIELTLLVGRYAQAHFLRGRGLVSVTAATRDWRAHAPRFIPPPHPSPRNIAWFKANPWFDDELVVPGRPEHPPRFDAGSPRQRVVIVYGTSRKAGAVQMAFLKL